MKIKNYLVLILVILLFFSCKTKFVTEQPQKKELNYIPYYLKVYKADSLYLTNNYQKSYEILDSLFQEYEPLNMEGYYEYSNYIASSVLSGHTEGIDEKIKKGYLNFGDIRSLHADSFKIYDEVMKTSKLSKNEIELLKQEYSKKINLELRKQIATMFTEDQSVRMENYNEEGIKKFQEKHKKEIEEIIAKYGYPNYQVIGSVNYSDNENSSEFPIEIRGIFLHQDSNTQEKYLPLLFEALKKGKFSPDEYAAIYDKSLWNKTNDHKQFYGSFPRIPLLHPTKIDSIRKSIGLFHLGYDLWKVKEISKNNINSN